jgi:hypothetical protein
VRFKPVLEILRLVRHSATEMIRDNNPVRPAEFRYEFTEKKRPRRVSVNHYNRLALAFVDIMIVELFELEIIVFEGVDVFYR